MTKITLRRAATIQQEIQEKLKKNPIETAPEISIFEDFFVARSAAKASLLENTHQTIALIGALYDVRDLVNDKNHEVGINRLLTKQARMSADLALYEKLAEKMSFETDDVLQKRAERMKTAEVSSSPYGKSAPVERISVVLIDDQERLMFQKEADRIRLLRNAVRDEISSINASAFIEIPDETESILRDAGLL